MTTILLTIHILIALALVGAVLLQRSEGGALGIGGGGGGGGFMTGRGAANALTRATSILAACFFLTSISLGLIANSDTGPSSVLDTTLEPIAAPEAVPEPPSTPAVPEFGVPEFGAPETGELSAPSAEQTEIPDLAPPAASEPAAEESEAEESDPPN